MSMKPPSVLLEKMLFYAGKLEEAGKNLTEIKLQEFWTAAGVAKIIEELGETAIKISQEIKDKYSGIPWNNIIKMRHVLVHHYETAEVGYMWNVISKEVSRLIPMLKKALDDEIRNENDKETKLPS